MNCAECGVPLCDSGTPLSPAKCAFCVGRELERKREWERHNLPKCAICKRPLDTESPSARKGYWKVKGKLSLNWYHAGACETLAREKTTFQSVNWREVKKASEQGKSRLKTWEQRRLDVKLEAKALGRELVFYCFAPKGRAGIGSQFIGKLIDAKVIPPSGERNFEKGSIKIATRLGRTNSRGETVFDDVTLSFDSLSLAKSLVPLLKGSPGRPGMQGAYIGIVIPDTSGEKEYHKHEVYYDTSVDALLAEMNADTHVIKKYRDKFGIPDFEFSFVTWFEGIDSLYLSWREKHASELGIHPETGDNIPF